LGKRGLSGEWDPGTFQGAGAGWFYGNRGKKIVFHPGRSSDTDLLCCVTWTKGGGDIGGTGPAGESNCCLGGEKKSFSQICFPVRQVSKDKGWGRVLVTIHLCKKSRLKGRGSTVGACERGFTTGVCPNRFGTGGIKGKEGGGPEVVGGGSGWSGLGIYFR